MFRFQEVFSVVVFLLIIVALYTVFEDRDE